MLLNQARAQEILERENLDGLIAQTPNNLYYLSDYWGLFNTAGGYDAAYLAVLPRDDREPAGLIVPALELRRLETTGGTWMPNVFAHSAPDPEKIELLADGTPPGSDYLGWPIRADTSLSELEQRWVDIVCRAGLQTSPDAFWAMTRAVKAAGLANGRVATDDARIADWLAACGLDDLHCEYRPELFNEIRLVKTAAEVAIMREAATINEAALLAAADGMREGDTWEEIENVYMMEMARRGGRGVYLMCGVGELPAGYVRRDEPILFDALGQYHHYHGDFGRCAVVGEPGPEQQRRHRAMCAGWDVAQSLLVPGVNYSQLSNAVGDVVRREGFKDFRDPVVHSLGLEHTDDPKPWGVQPQTKPDQVLRPGMVVNVDMPHTEIGWGSVHMEDTVLITEDGCERLSAADFSIRIAP
jgi:Xaa-Pro dipeptidase